MSSLNDLSAAVIIVMIVKDCDPLVCLNLYSCRRIAVFRRNMHISATSPASYMMSQPKRPLLQFNWSFAFSQMFILVVCCLSFLSVNTIEHTYNIWETFPHLAEECDVILTLVV